MIAEGVVLDVDPEDLERLHEVERDEHGHIRIAEVNIGEILKAQVAQRLKAFGIKTTIVAKNIGYELRCADPIPFDMEYTRDLGYCAAKYLLAGGQRRDDLDGRRPFVPIPFSVLLDPETGRTRVRLVDIHVDAIRDRATLHDPAAPRRFRGSRTSSRSSPPPPRCRSSNSVASSSISPHSSRRQS